MSMDSLKEEVSVKKIYPLAIAGMVMAFVPLFNCFAFPVSIIALVRTRNNDLEYKGIECKPDYIRIDDPCNPVGCATETCGCKKKYLGNTKY